MQENEHAPYLLWHTGIVHSGNRLGELRHLELIQGFVQMFAASD
jgi:hypothetical protein